MTVRAPAIRLTLCANGCGQTLEQPPTGRPRLYCSDRCKNQATRRRRALPWPPSAPPGYPTDPGVVNRRTVEALLAVLDGAAPAPAEDQLAQALLEIDWIAYRLAALERELTRADLAGRAGALAQHLRHARRQVFPEIKEVQET